MKITVKMLQAKNACHDQVELFSKLFPDGAEVNHKNADIAHRAELDIGWAARHFLSPDALVEYERSRGTARAEYNRIEGIAWAEYKRNVIAWAEYDHIRVTAWAEYQRICAHAFVDAARGE